MCPPHTPWYLRSPAAYLYHLMTTDPHMTKLVDDWADAKDDEMDWLDWVGV